jgi:hypothetical protein
MAEICSQNSDGPQAGGPRQYVTRARFPVKALVWTGDNVEEMLAFVPTAHYGKVVLPGGLESRGMELWVPTRFGLEEIPVGDYVLRSPAGHFARYPPQDFEKLYELVP